MCNEELCLAIQSGQSELIEELWNQIDALALSQAGLFYMRYQERCKQVSVTIEDLRQVGFFALKKAIEKFNPNRGTKFSTCFCWYLKGEFYTLAKMRSTGWREKTTDNSLSLNLPAFETGHCEIEWVDTLSNPLSESAFESVELRNDIMNALEYIPARQRSVFKSIYLLDIRPVDIARRLNVTRATVNGLRVRAINALVSSGLLSGYEE